MKTRVLLVLALALAPLHADESVAELKKEIARLEALVERLSTEREGTVPTVNLARTSLASVSASSVNGKRPLTNRFYGVRNAFDDGTNWHNGINYTYWLSSGEPWPWIEVRFDVPVTVRSIVVEGAPPFSTRLFPERGGEISHPTAKEKLELEAPRAGVRRVRLTFEPEDDRHGNIKVHEVRVNGYAPDGANVEAGAPRIAMSRAHAVGTAKDRFEEWKQALVGVAQPTCEETKDGWVVVYRLGKQALFRVRVGKDGRVQAEPLVKLASVR